MFLLVVVLYGVFAMQGTLPLMSPDETAAFAVARQIVHAGSPIIFEARAAGFSWLHPRSFIAQNGTLLPVGFPLWMVVLSMVGWIGNGGAILWLAVIVSASFVIPGAFLAEERFAFSKKEALALALAIATLPTIIIYGNRSLFTLVPQLSLACWTVWLITRAQKPWERFVIGILAAISIGLRPVEGIWLLPLYLMMWGDWGRGPRLRGDDGGRKGSGVIWGAGFLGGAMMVLGVQMWVYGSPFAIGYLLRDVPSVVTAAIHQTTHLSWWRPFFPYGFSRHQWWQNIRGTFVMGWWPWMVLSVTACIVWWKRARKSASRLEKHLYIWLIGTTVWLSFYYGQGRFADNIGGQLFHLGNSLFRYQAPLLVGWTVWSLWVVRTYVSAPWNRRLFFALVAGSITVGSYWAIMDDQDGLLVNRVQREQYAAIRTFVDEQSAPNTLWLSERSDKMVFPSRLSATIPSLQELKRYLQVEKQPVWLFRRPPSQTERDQWTAEGLVLVVRRAFARESVFEVTLRNGF